MSETTAVLSANRGFALLRSRSLLMSRLINSGWRVVVATRVDPESAELGRMGAIVEEVEFSRGGPAVKSDLEAVLRLRQILRLYRPHLIHNFNAKPMILGSVASIGLRPRPLVVNTLTGLGHSLAGGLSSLLSRQGYRLSGRRAVMTIFQNYEDERLFLDRGYVRPECARLIIGSGVDVSQFRPLPADRRRGILMVTRLLRQKGVIDFLEAARAVRRRRPELHFALAGEWEDSHPDAVSRQIVEKSVQAGDVDFLGYIDDLEKVLPEYALFVFPSYYREGVPRVLLEAAACGLPLIAADAPGAREVVLPGETGWLVPPGNPAELAGQILRAFEDGEEMARLGSQARALACKRFDVRETTTEYLEVYEDIGLDIGSLSNA